MRIRPFSTPGRFWRGNLHAHSNLSDGALHPGDVVDAYKRAGYDFLQVSDHFLGRFDWPIADTRKLRCKTFTTLIGAEVHAMGTSAGEYWHIVATGLPFDFPPAEPGESAAAAGGASARGRRFRRDRPSVVVATDDRGRAFARRRACGRGL